MLFGKAAQQSGQEVGRDGRDRAEADASAASGLGEFRKRVLHELQDVFRSLEQQLTELGEHHLAWFAVNDRLAELVLELLDRAAQRGLREMQFLRGAGEVLRAGENDELIEEVEVEIAAHASG